MRRVPLILLLLIFAGTFRAAVAGPGGDQPAGPEAVKGAIVMVVAKGVLTSQGNVQVAEQGTGFFISKYGFLVTSYHLRQDLGAVDEATVSYEVHFGALSSDVVPASAQYSSDSADILVLAAPVVARDVPTLRFANVAPNRIVPGKTVVYTGGYPKGYDFAVDQGIIKSMGVISPPLPLWATSLTFKAGQSGSPILLEDNTVIGIAKGIDTDANSIGLMVPAKLVPPQFWDTAFAATAIPPVSNGPPVRLLIQANVKPTAPVRKTAVFTLANDHCRPLADRKFTVSASPGGRIDTNSIKVDVLSLQGSVTYSIAQANATGFIIAGLLNNVGSCVSLLGRQLQFDVAATLVGRVSYTETLDPNTARLVTVSDVNAAANVNVPLPKLPVNSLTFTAIDSAGKHISFKPNSLELTKENGITVLDTAKALKRVFSERNG